MAAASDLRPTHRNQGCKAFAALAPCGVIYATHKPTPPLDAFVSNLWLLSDAPAHSRETIVPSGTLELVINLEQDEIRVYESADSPRFRRYPGAVVSGAFRGPFVIDTREHASIIGAHFKTGGAFPFLGVPADDLVDAHVELETLWSPRDTSRLRERLCSSSTAEERFRLLEGSLRAHLFRPLRPRRAVEVALHHLGRQGACIAEVADRLGLSHRRFIEVFRETVGMTPKLFLRVQRFQSALALARAHRVPPWSQLALACGYFDQAHLIRDFQQFAGMTPTDYARRQGERVKEGHIALSEQGSNLSNTPHSTRRTLRRGDCDVPTLQALPKDRSTRVGSLRSR